MNPNIALALAVLLPVSILHAALQKDGMRITWSLACSCLISGGLVLWYGNVQDVVVSDDGVLHQISPFLPIGLFLLAFGGAGLLHCVRPGRKPRPEAG